MRLLETVVAFCLVVIVVVAMFRPLSPSRSGLDSIIEQQERETATAAVATNASEVARVSAKLSEISQQVDLLWQSAQTLTERQGELSDKVFSLESYHAELKAQQSAKAAPTKQPLGRWVQRCIGGRCQMVWESS